MLTAYEVQKKFRCCKRVDAHDRKKGYQTFNALADEDSKKFKQSFYERSLDDVAQTFSSLSINHSQKKALSILDDKQLFLLGVNSVLPNELKKHVVGLLFNGHKQTIEEYCKLPFYEMVQQNVKMEAFKKCYPMIVVGKNAKFHCSYEHYFNMTEREVSCLSDAITSGGVVLSADREMVARALFKLKTVEENKMHQRRLLDQNEIAEIIIEEPFSYTVNFNEHENGMKKETSDCVTIPEYCARWTLSSPQGAQKLACEIFRKNQWNDFCIYLKRCKQSDFQFEGDIVITPSFRDRFNAICRSFGLHNLGAGTPFKWGGKQIAIMSVLGVIYSFGKSLGIADDWGSIYLCSAILHSSFLGIELWLADKWYIDDILKKSINLNQFIETELNLPKQ